MGVIIQGYVEVSTVLGISKATSATTNLQSSKVNRFNCTAKEIAADIGEMLIEVKRKVAHGEFEPWVTANCSFSPSHSRKYMQVAKAKLIARDHFDMANSIREVLNIRQPKPEPTPVHRAATLNDLRKVERLRALRDDPAASEGERVNAEVPEGMNLRWSRS